MAIVLPMASSNAHGSAHAHDHHHPSLRSQTLSSSTSSAPTWSSTTNGSNNTASATASQSHYHYPPTQRPRHQRTQSESRVEPGFHGQTRRGWEQEEGFHPQPRSPRPFLSTTTAPISIQNNTREKFHRRSVEMERRIPSPSRSSPSNSSASPQRRMRSRSASVEMMDEEDELDEESFARPRLRRVYPMRIDDEDDEEDEEEDEEEEGEEDERGLTKRGYMHPLRPAVFPIRDSPSPELRMVRSGFGGPPTTSMSTSASTSVYSHSIAQRLPHENVNGSGMNTATATIAVNGGNGGGSNGGAGGNGGLGVHRTRRPRRRADEVERLYKCTWNGCEKSYGTLSHLNDHVRLQRHGNKREPHEFKEARRVWRQERKSRRLREHAIHAAQAAQQTASSVHHSHSRMHTLSSSATGGIGITPASHSAHLAPRQLLDDIRSTLTSRPYSSSGGNNREDIRPSSSSYDSGYQQRRAYPPPPQSQAQQQPSPGEQQITEQPQSRLGNHHQQRHHHQNQIQQQQHQHQYHESSGENQRRQVAEWTQANSRFSSALEYEEALRRRRVAARSGPGSPEASPGPLSLSRDSELIGPSAAVPRSSLRPQSQSQTHSRSSSRAPGSGSLLGLRDIREPDQHQVESGDQRESRLGLALGHPRYHHSPSGSDYPHSRVVASSSNNSNISSGGGGGSNSGSLLFSRDNRPFSPSPVPSPFLGPSNIGSSSLSTSNTLAPPPPAHGVRPRAATIPTLTSLSSDSDSIVRMQQQLASQMHSPSTFERKYEDDAEMARLRRMGDGDGDGKYWDRDRDGDEKILIKRSPSPSGSVIHKGDSATLRLPSIAELRLDLSLDEFEAETTLGSLSTAGTTKKAGQQQQQHHHHHLQSYGIGGASASDRIRDSSALASAGTVTPTAIRPSSATPTTVDYYQHNQSVRAVRHRHRDSWESPSPRLGDGSRANSAQGSTHAFPQQQHSHSHSLAPPPSYHVYQQQQLQAQAQQQQNQTRPQTQSLTPTRIPNELESPRSTGAQHLSSPDYTSHYRFRIAPPPQPPSSSVATMTATPSSSGMSLSSATTSPSIDSQHLRGALPPPPPPPSSYPHHGHHNHLPRSRTSSNSGGRRLSTSRPSTSASTTSSTTTSSNTAHHTIQYPFIQASLPRVHSTPEVRAGSSSDGKGPVMITATPGVVSGEPRRKRRKYEEIERRYQCGWNGCTKAYGTLNHLNDHVSLQNHGPKRRSSEF